MRGLWHEVALMAVRTANDGNVFDHQQLIARAISLCDLLNEGAFFPAVIAKHIFPFQIE